MSKTLTDVSDCRLTTFDNPYNPFTQFVEWLLFDNANNYFTLNKLARIEQTNESMSEREINIEHERAIDEIIQNDFLNIYKKVYRNEETQE